MVPSAGLFTSFSRFTLGRRSGRRHTASCRPSWPSSLVRLRSFFSSWTGSAGAVVVAAGLAGGVISGATALVGMSKAGLTEAAFTVASSELGAVIGAAGTTTGATSGTTGSTGAATGGTGTTAGAVVVVAIGCSASGAMGAVVAVVVSGISTADAACSVCAFCKVGVKVKGVGMGGGTLYAACMRSFLSRSWSEMSTCVGVLLEGEGRWAMFVLKVFCEIKI